MSYDHREIVQLVDHLKFKVNDLIDDRNHPYGKALLREVNELATDVKVKKPLRSIEIRINAILGRLHDIRNHGDQIMDYSHTDLFMRQCNEIRGHVQQYYPF